MCAYGTVRGERGAVKRGQVFPTLRHAVIRDCPLLPAYFLANGFTNGDGRSHWDCLTHFRVPSSRGVWRRRELILLATATDKRLLRLSLHDDPSLASAALTIHAEGEVPSWTAPGAVALATLGSGS